MMISKENMSTIEAATERLAEIDSFASTVVDRVTDGVCVCHEIESFPHVRFTIWNRQMHRITGYTMEEINREGWYQTLYPDSAVQTEARRRMDRMRKGEDLNAEAWRITRRDGAERSVRISTNRLETYDGIVHILACVRDDTEEKRTRRAIQESEERFRCLAENIQEVFWLRTPTEMLYISPAYERVFGRSCRSLYEDPASFLVAVHPDDKDRVAAALEEEMARETHFRERYRVVHPDGTVRWVLARSFPVSSRRKERWSAGIALDITARTIAAQALKDREARLRSILMAAPIGIGVVKERVILQVNDPLCRLLGYDRDDLIGRSARIFYESEEEFERVGREKYSQIRSGGTGSVETRFRHKKGHFIDVLLSSAPLENRSGEVTFTVLDITARNRTEDMLRQAKHDLENEVRQRTAELHAYADRLEAKNRELEDFAHVASHDLQEPLRKVQTLANLLALEMGGKLSEDAADYLRRMQDAAVRMRHMIAGLLAYARVSTHDKALHPVNLNETFAQVLSNLSVAIDEKGARVTAEDLPTVYAEPYQMEQLFQNLISNAIKFNDGDAPNVHVSAELANRAWKIRVDDNGIGFEPRYAEQIFNPFKKLHGRGRYEGAGIGLATCSKIVERHGGGIEARGRPGRGATFVVTLPRDGPTP